MPDIRINETKTEAQRHERAASVPEAEVEFSLDPTIAPFGALATQRLVALQRLAGNEAVNRLMAQRRVGRTLTPNVGRRTPPDATKRSPQARTPLQRQAPSAPAKPATLTLGSITVTTYGELYSASLLFKSQLKTDAAEVPVGQPSRTSADDLVKQVEGWAPILQSKGSDPLDDPAVSQATIWYQAFVQARKDLESWKKTKVRDDLKTGDAAADESRTAVDGIPDSLADLKRGAFFSKNEEVLEHCTEITGYALQLSSALLESHKESMEMAAQLSDEATHADELIEKFGPLIEVGHKVVAAYEGLSKALTVLHGGEGATDIDKAASKASAGLGLASAAGSLTGVAAGYMAYFQLLVWLGQTAIKVVASINREEAHMINRFYLEQRDFNSVLWSAEPGHRAAFDFMVLVMHAGSSADIPTPIPEAVDEFMVESRKLMEEGTGEEVPTEGYWFWRHTNPAKVKYWLMRNRDNIWAMLYGSFKPP